MKKILTIFLVVVLLTGCANKTHKTENTSTIRSFLITESKDTYLFIGDKYSYLVKDPKSVKKINRHFRNIQNAKSWNFTSYFSRITLRKNGKAHIMLSYIVEPNPSQLSYFKKMNYRKNEDNTYTIHINLFAKYAYNDKNFIDKHKSKFLKKPINFELVSQTQKESSGDLHPISALAYGVFVVPVALVGMIVGIIGGPNSYK